VNRFKHFLQTRLRRITLAESMGLESKTESSEWPQ
jgi:hypothetical protein